MAKGKTDNKETRQVRSDIRKRSALNIIFGKSTFLVLVILVEIGLFIFAMIKLFDYVSVFVVALASFTAAMLIYLARTSSSPEVKLSWMAIVLLLPIIGAMTYIWVHTSPGCKMEKKKIDEIEAATSHFVYDDKEVREKFSGNGYTGTADYLKNAGKFPAFDKSDIKYFPSGEAYFESLKEELEKAEKFIFLEFFIIKEGYMWETILDILKRKAAAGVEIRVLYDGSCAILDLPYDYPKTLAQYGIKAMMYSRLRPFVSTTYNNRDHRKIVVVDGKVAFTGGSNLADEYINLRHPFGQWKDASVMISGSAVSGFTLMFLRMWDVEAPHSHYEYGRYISSPQNEGAVGFVVPYGDMPLGEERLGEFVYTDIINRAEKYVYIMSPYLILDGELLSAFSLAAKKGVDVRIILPHIPDKKYAFALAKSHYKQLTSYGVKIYEYTPGFVHSKVFLSDDKHGVVGTVNLDYRSLYHHFECALYMNGTDSLKEIKTDFEETFKISMPVTEETIKNEKFGTRLRGKLLKIIAPLM